LKSQKEHAKLFKRFGKLRVMVLEPAYWSIGEMTRYLRPDIEDMEAVFKKGKVGAQTLGEVWGKALRNSPRSAAQSLFKRQVEDFLTHLGPQIWGKKFDAAKTIGVFHRSAGIKTGGSSGK
jgi:hypothetical protein